MAMARQRPPPSAGAFPPLNFFYTHFHNSMKAELEALTGCVAALDAQEAGDREGPLAALLALRERYRFLEQVYKYHSSVEDEVVYPALDAKVKNVTMAYRVEHQDEELLLEQCAQLIGVAIAAAGPQEMQEAVRGLLCKVEEVHRTLKKHLAKEEEQLVPLLLAHFSAAEQAELVAQFLYCIPLAMVERVLAWLKPQVPQVEQEQLLQHIQAVVPDRLLLQLLTGWLQHAPAADGSDAMASAAATLVMPQAEADDASAFSATPPPAPGDSNSSRPPLQEVLHIHRTICAALAEFASEARNLRARSAVSARQLAALAGRHRFLRSVCMFHTISEEEVMYPEVRRLAAAVAGPGGGAAASACATCAFEHETEGSALDDLGRLLADVRAFARRGRKEVADMLARLVSAAEAVTASIRQHMAQEESDVFPLLERHLGVDAQRRLVWRTLCAMPLRLLERILPWVTGTLPAPRTAELLANIRLGAPDPYCALVRLMVRWAEQGAAAVGGPCGAHAWAAGPGLGLCCPSEALVPRPSVEQVGSSSDPDEPPPPAASGAGGSPQGERAAKRPRIGDAAASNASPCPTASPAAHITLHPPPPLGPAAAAGEGSSAQAAAPVEDQGPGVPGGDVGGRNPFNPIDHIFQFHQALRQELRQLEADALRVERAVLAHFQSQETAGPGGAPGPPKTAAALSAIPETAETDAETAPQQQPDSVQSGATTVEVEGSSSPSSPEGGQESAPRATAEASAEASGAAGSACGGAGSVVAATAGAAHTAISRLPSTHHHVTATAAVSTSSSSYLSRLPKRVAAAIQALDGRFQFLWGIYRAHSRSEDEIVFPALESKQALRNVSHAYALDHQQEEGLFLDLEKVMDTLRSCGDRWADARAAALTVRRMCAALRASLETHIRAEEAELWPLFTEHFSHEEQQYLVGVIIGRTGAQVLQALVPWISESFSVEEKELMMGSLRQATRNTMFDQWLEAISHQGAPPLSGPNPPPPPPPQDQPLPDPELARYLGSPPATTAAGAGGEHPATHGPIAGASGAPVSAAAATVESSTFRPGWEDIFRMNQKQLEAAVLRVSADPGLEPGRKSYLIQNIMVSKYIVAQQRRMQKEQLEGEDADGLLLPGPEGDGLLPGTAQLCAVPNALALSCDTGARAGGSGVSGAPSRPKWRRTFHDASTGTLGCKHYRRKAALVAPCCGRAYTCRLCHDEAVSHRMDRYAVSEMVCMECGLQQPVGGACSGCGTQLARYYCSICHLFDDEPGRHIYHCPFCNVCRRGQGLGIDFFHCMDCNACMSLSLFNSHKCRERAMEANCPVCSEYLFDSADPIKELPCGHLLHSRCFAEYTRYNYTCPLCSKSVGDMSVYFQMLDSLLASERLPPEYAGRMQQVLCNDCGKTGFARFHFAYHACPHCRSYNTRVM